MPRPALWMKRLADQPVLRPSFRQPRPAGPGSQSVGMDAGGIRRSAGVVGMLVADALSHIVIYLVEAWRLNRLGLWLPQVDVLFFLLFYSIGAASFFLGPIAF